MGAIVVAILVGLLAVGLVGLIVVFSALAIAGLKAMNAAHDGGTWFAERFRRRHPH
jgi:hypothetical protein